MRCPRCGTEYRAGTKFCGECGTQLPRKSGRGIFKALLSTFLFIAIFYTCQVVVPQMYMASIAAGDGRFIGAAQRYSEAIVNEEISDSEKTAAADNFSAAIEALAEKMTQKIAEHATLITLISDLAAVLIICLIFRLRKREPKKELNVRMCNPMRLLTFALFGAALSFIISCCISFIPLPEQIINSYNAQFELTSGSSEPIALRIASIVLVVPITEEIVFRSLAMRNLKPTMGRTAAVIISSLIFGLFHFGFTLGSLISVAYATIIGIVFGIMYVKYNSIIPTIICHAAFNLVGFLPISTDSSAAGAMFVIALAVAAFCVYRIFIRYPVFSDVLSSPDSIEAVNEEDGRILARIREIKTGSEPISNEELDRLSAEWEDNRRSHKEKKKDSSSEE